MAGLNLNACFLQWLTEWHEKERSKVKYVYAKAIKALKKYPIPLESCQDALVGTSFALVLTAQQLESFGPFIVKKLETQLRAHCIQIGAPFPAVEVVRSAAVAWDEADTRVAKRPRKQRDYIPKYRSGPYAILLAFLEAEKVG
jgi:crossover junction endonuclease MUS81